jgi:hypothetical protein
MKENQNNKLDLSNSFVCLDLILKTQYKCKTIILHGKQKKVKTNELEVKDESFEAIYTVSLHSASCFIIFRVLPSKTLPLH